MLAALEYDNRDDDDRSWWAEASCNTGDAGLAALFFSEELQDIAAAKRISRGVPGAGVVPRGRTGPA